ncbi:hypothetical protein SAMN05444162_2143 [Paenibacillaceae bacterium GAS479]|nr:hypothetical protein SAMN05444162_2143 [Paenibacillaceae bacterium GAS479]
MKDSQHSLASYVIGVDGGNSKTGYYLFDLEGNRIDSIPAGTRSHEQFSDDYLALVPPHKRNPVPS